MRAGLLLASRSVGLLAALLVRSGRGRAARSARWHQCGQAIPSDVPIRFLTGTPGVTGDACGFSERVMGGPLRMRWSCLARWDRSPWHSGCINEERAEEVQATQSNNSEY